MRTNTLFERVCSSPFNPHLNGGQKACRNGRPRKRRRVSPRSPRSDDARSCGPFIFSHPLHPGVRFTELVTVAIHGVGRGPQGGRNLLRVDLRAAETHLDVVILLWRGVLESVRLQLWRYARTRLLTSDFSGVVPG